MNRVRSNTDNELVNLRINLEEAKNENVTILQVWLLNIRLIDKSLCITFKIQFFFLNDGMLIGVGKNPEETFKC